MSNDFSGHVSVGGWRKDNFSANLGDSARQLSNIWVRDAPIAKTQVPVRDLWTFNFRCLILLKYIQQSWAIFVLKAYKKYKCIIY